MRRFRGHVVGVDRADRADHALVVRLDVARPVDAVAQRLVPGLVDYVRQMAVFAGDMLEEAGRCLGLRFVRVPIDDHAFVFSGIRIA